MIFSALRARWKSITFNFQHAEPALYQAVALHNHDCCWRGPARPEPWQRRTGGAGCGQQPPPCLGDGGSCPFAVCRGDGQLGSAGCWEEEGEIFCVGLSDTPWQAARGASAAARSPQDCKRRALRPLNSLHVSRRHRSSAVREGASAERR